MLRGSSRALISLLALLCASFVGNMARGQDAPVERQPVPKSGPQAKELKAIRDQYRAEYAKRDAADQLALANEFLKQAARYTDNPVKQYVLLREARELAVNAGEMDVAFRAIDQTTRSFLLDPTELKVTAMTDMLDRGRAPPTRLFEQYLKLATDALWNGDEALAAQATQLAGRVARGLHDPQMLKRVKEVDLRVHDARREQTAVIAAVHKLQATPDDPQANYAVGRFVCYVQGKWHDGLPLLARGSDPKLKDLAERDVEGPVGASAMLELADGWWDVPNAAATPARRSHARAARWYEQALPRLSGEQRARAEQRIAQAKAEQEPH